MKKLDKKYVKRKKGYYNFLCDCGNTQILRGDSKKQFCQEFGCTAAALRQHGEYHTRLYSIWDGIKSRCIFSHHSSKTYKNRGITICVEWLEFTTFKNWAINNNYTDDLCIDRLDINGNYEPRNCEWITRAENTRRQVADGHSNVKRILLNNIEYPSIAAAARHIKKFTKTTLSSIQAALEIRIKTNNLKPYKGFIAEKAKEVVDV